MSVKTKEIQIRRKEMNSHLPATVIQESSRKLGSVFVSRSPLRGLTKEQEIEHLPRVLGVNADSTNFEKVTREYWADFGIDVPSEGVVLNITTDDNGKPVVIDDWIAYQWAKRHPLVAKDKDAMNRDALATFYIYDPDVEVQRDNDGVQDKKAAWREFIKASKERKVMDRLYRVLTHRSPEPLSDLQIENQLQTTMEADPKAFLKVALDKDLETRELIFELLEHSILRKVGNSFLYHDDVIGNTTEEAIIYLNNKRNSRVVAELKAKLKEFTSDGITRQPETKDEAADEADVTDEAENLVEAE